MPLEIEIKFPVTDLAEVRRAAQGLGAHCLGRCFEENIVFDDPERSLRRRGMLLRLRSAGVNTLTLKRPCDLKTAECYKAMDEVETIVEDFAAMTEVLTALGYEPALRYEKVRETWDLDGVHICLDLLPFGRFVELEGEEEAIERTAKRLGLPLADGCARNYHELRQEAQRRAGVPLTDDFVFTEEARLRLKDAENDEAWLKDPAGI